MRTFCVAFHSNFEGYVEQAIIEAESEPEACIIVLTSKGYELESDNMTLEQVEELAANCDCWVTATDLTNVKIL